MGILRADVIGVATHKDDPRTLQVQLANLASHHGFSRRLAELTMQFNAVLVSARKPRLLPKETHECHAVGAFVASAGLTGTF